MIGGQAARERVMMLDEGQHTAHYKAMLKEMDLIFREHDPMGLIAMGAPDDEYAPEISTIIPRLRTARDSQEMTRIVYEEFVRWFGDSSAGPQSAYAKTGEAVWKLRIRYFGEAPVNGREPTAENR